MKFYYFSFRKMMIEVLPPPLIGQRKRKRCSANVDLMLPNPPKMWALPRKSRGLPLTTP